MYIILFSIIEHKIQLCHIPNLLADTNMLNELIPNIGDRLSFIQKSKEFISQKKDNVSSCIDIIKYLCNNFLLILMYTNFLSRIGYLYS